jgi:hypothetical protein
MARARKVRRRLAAFFHSFCSGSGLWEELMRKKPIAIRRTDQCVDAVPDNRAAPGH